MELFDQPQNNQCVTIIVFRALIKLHPIADVKTRRFFLDGTHRSPPTSTVCSRSPSGCALTSPCRMPAQGGRKRFANSSLGRDRGSCCLVYPDRSVDARLRCAKGSTFPEICFELSFSDLLSSLHPKTRCQVAQNPLPNSQDSHFPYRVFVLW